MSGAGIYIKWDNKLWQEQPDGSYLLWDEEQRLWVHSAKQPPSEGPVQTKECPNCGRRVKRSFRSCPHCEFGFGLSTASLDTAPRPAVAEFKEKKTRAKKAPQTIEVSPLVSLAAVLAVLVLAYVGYVKYAEARSCSNWNDAMRTTTELQIRIEAVGDSSYEQMLEENKSLHAASRPEGCE